MGDNLIFSDQEVGISTGALVHCRDDLAIALPAARRWSDIVEINLAGDRLEQFEEICLNQPQLLEDFASVTIHAPQPAGFKLCNGVSDSGEFELVEKLLELRDHFHFVVKHPEYIGLEQWGELCEQLLIENMDHRSHFGQGIDDLEKIFSRYPRSNFCLDLAHTHHIDPSERLANHLMDHFANRLRQMHLSRIGEDGQHRGIGKNDLFWMAPLVERAHPSVLLIWEELPAFIG